MTNLAGFLRDRLEEDEQTARDALGCEGATNSYTEISTTETQREQAHTDRWTPTRVLAEIDAKRRIIAIYASWSILAEPGAGFQIEKDAGVTLLAMREALRALALPYADHPDYREEWRP